MTAAPDAGQIAIGALLNTYRRNDHARQYRRTFHLPVSNYVGFAEIVLGQFGIDCGQKCERQRYLTAFEAVTRELKHAALRDRDYLIEGLRIAEFIDATICDQMGFERLFYECGYVATKPIFSRDWSNVIPDLNATDAELRHFNELLHADVGSSHHLSLTMTYLRLCALAVMQLAFERAIEAFAVEPETARRFNIALGRNLGRIYGDLLYDLPSTMKNCLNA